MKNQRRWFFNLSAFVLIISLTFGCTFGIPVSPSKPAVVTTVPTLTQNELLQAAFENVRNDPQYDGETGVIQAERNIKHAIRETGGARAILGDQADVVFQQFDAAEIAAVERLVAQIKALSGTPGRAGLAQPVSVNKLIRVMNIPPGSSELQFKTMGIISTFLLFPILLADLPRDENGEVVLPPMEDDETKRHSEF